MSAVSSGGRRDATRKRGRRKGRKVELTFSEQEDPVVLIEGHNLLGLGFRLLVRRSLGCNHSLRDVKAGMEEGDQR